MNKKKGNKSNLFVTEDHYVPPYEFWGKCAKFNDLLINVICNRLLLSNSSTTNQATTIGRQKVGQLTRKCCCVCGISHQIFSIENDQLESCI